jgi:ribosomal protein S18 acetylase RimI-like enzyme
MNSPDPKNKETVVNIRNANQNDLDAIHQVLSKGFNALRNRGYSMKAIEAAISPPKLIQDRLGLSEIRVIVATSKDQVIGTVTGTKRFGHLHIQSLAVDPRFQRCKVGSRLIMKLEEEARQTNCRKLFAQTAWAMFEAIKLYWRLGFSLEGYHPGHFWGEDLLSFGKIL